MASVDLSREAEGFPGVGYKSLHGLLPVAQRKQQTNDKYIIQLLFFLNRQAYMINRPSLRDCSLGQPGTGNQHLAEEGRTKDDEDRTSECEQMKLPNPERKIWCRVCLVETKFRAEDCKRIVVEGFKT